MRKISTNHLPSTQVKNLIDSGIRHWIALDNKSLLDEYSWCKLVTFEEGLCEVFALTGADTEKLVGVIE